MLWPLEKVYWLLKNIFYYVGTGIGRGLAAIVNTYEKVTGSYQAGTGLEGLPKTGYYFGHKGEIIINPAESASIRASARGQGTVKAGGEDALSRGAIGQQIVKKEYHNIFNVNITPQYMTGDRNSARALAQDLKRELQRLDIRWGNA
jgi:hypothetical protein